MGAVTGKEMKRKTQSSSQRQGRWGETEQGEEKEETQGAEIAEAQPDADFLPQCQM